jgi:plasmid stabilization system protein ParE
MPEPLDLLEKLEEGAVVSQETEAQQHLSRENSLVSLVRLEYTRADRDRIWSELRREAADSRRPRLGRGLRRVFARAGATSRSPSHTSPARRFGGPYTISAIRSYPETAPGRGVA